jgi:hypothetical protein
MGLYARRPPSLHRVPVSPVPRLRRYYEAATTSRSARPLAYEFAFGFRVGLAVRARLRAPDAAKSAIGPGAVVPPVLRCRLYPHGRRRDLSGFLVTRPVPLPCSQTPAEPVFLAMAEFPMLPRIQQGEGFGASMISRLTQGFSTRCLRFTNAVAVAHARLASGWRAPPLPGGRRTLWVTMKGFRSHPSSFPGLVLTQAGRTLAGRSLSWPILRQMPGARRKANRPA